MPILLSTQFSAIRVKPSAFVHMHIKWTYQTKRLPDVFFSHQPSAIITSGKSFILFRSNIQRWALLDFGVNGQLPRTTSTREKMPISFENYECYYFWQVNLNLDEVFIEKKNIAWIQKISHKYRKYRSNRPEISQNFQNKLSLGIQTINISTDVLNILRIVTNSGYHHIWVDERQRNCIYHIGNDP